MSTEAERERLKVYQAELAHAKEYRAKFYEDRWRLYRSMYAHRDPLFCGDDHKRARVQVNYVHSTINVIMASTLHRYPKITATARNAESFERSVIVEHALNQQWQTKNWQEPHRLALLDKLIFGHGWVKTTYQFDQEEREMTDAEFEDVFNEQMSIAISLHREGKRAFPTDEAIRASIERKGTHVLKDQVQVERVSPWSVYMDPYGKDLDSICWIAQEVVVKRREFSQDTRFPADVRDRVGGSSTTAGGNGFANNTTGMSFESVPEEVDGGTASDVVRYVEHYDIIEGTVSFFLSEGGRTQDGDQDYLIDPEPMPYAFGQPFHMLRGNEVPDRLYPMGEIEILADTQRELNDLRSEIVEQRKKGSRQYLYKPENVTDEFEEAMESDDDELLIPVKRDVPFNDVIAELPMEARINPQLYDLSAILQQDIFQLSGVADFQRGGGVATRTATQVAVENDAALARQARQLESIESAMATSARRALQLMQQFMTAEGVIRISNVGRHVQQTEQVQQRLGEVWYTFTREDVGGEYDIAIEAGSTRPINDSTRAQRALQLVNAALPFVQSGIIRQPELATFVLRELGVPNPESWVQDGRDPRGSAAAPEQQPQTPPSVAGGVGPIGAGPLPEQQPQQGDGATLDQIRQQLAGQTGLN